MGKILIVDDEKTMRFIFRRILTEVGHYVTEAANGVEAKEHLNSELFDVALVDRLLGSDNGLDIIQFMNRVQPSCTPILISGFPTFKSASEGFRLGVFEYLVKPVQKDELCRTVNAALKKKLENTKQI